MIETERTYLRAIERDDLPHRAAWLNDPVVRETLFLEFPVSLAETERWFERALQDPTRRDVIVVLKETEQPIGFIGWVNIDWHHRKAELNVAIGKSDLWGKGLATEVLRGVVDYSFRDLGLNRLYGYVLTTNTGSVKMAQRAGFKVEGTLKQDVLIHGEYCDRVSFGYTRDDYLSERSTETAAS
jgi:diamine N-acetyltransferase